MATRKRDDRSRGLPSLSQARAERQRAIVTGKVRLRSLPPQFWLWAAAVIAAVVVIYWKVEQGKLESQKGAVMAKQRAVAQSLGPKILPFRDKIEGWVEELGKTYAGDVVRSDGALPTVEKASGVYLRLRVADAKDENTIRKASLRSLHDGFTSCFYRKTKALDPSKGPKCQSSADCEPGLLCNEWDVCSPPPDPFNMRLAYRTLRVLSTAWTDELHEASNDLAIVAYERDLDRVTKEDVPIAAEILARARYFVAVLDEDPTDGVPADQDAGETEAERVQRVGHFARVGIWDLRSGELVARVRRRAEGYFVPVGERTVDRQETNFAQQRQANSCALALSVRTALTPKVPEEAAPDAGATDAGADGADAGAASVDSGHD
jgi:hypothetical protein